MKKDLPFSLTLICGAIGKEFVIKHYKDGTVKTKYPDMSGIVATVHQRKCRNLFKDAVAYAKEVIADIDRKVCWQKKLRKRNSVYNSAIKEYMLRAKKEKQNQFIETNRLLIYALKISGNGNDQAANSINIPAGIITEQAVEKLPGKANFYLSVSKKYLRSVEMQLQKPLAVILNST
ncbi:MAG: hypothetical protein ABI402_13890 [Ferruginibacter sp.]